MSAIPAFEIGIWNAWIFMVWLVIQTLVVSLTRKALSGKTSRSSETSPHPRMTGKTYQIISNLSLLNWLAATFYAIFLPLRLGTPWFYAGLAIFLPGLAILAITSVNFTTTPPTEPVTRGSYRYSRHPMYIALTLIYLGTSIASASWLFLLFSITMLAMVRTAAGIEERYCLERYGDAYHKYMKRTPRWLAIPGLKG